MGTVHGQQVVCKESALGVKGLVVEALDVPGPEFTTVAGAPKARRLASGFTGPDGSFWLAFDDKAEGQPGPINLLVAVSGPEESHQDPTPLRDRFI
jgi:hypothetical protein